LILDPAHYGPALKEELKKGQGLQYVRVGLQHFTHENYQIGFVKTCEVLKDEEMEKAKAMDYLGDMDNL